MEKEAEEYINELEDKVIDLSLRLKSKTNELNLVYKTNEKIIGKLIHNLKNPVGIIFSFSGMILENIEDYPIEKLEKHTQIINKSADFSIKLLNTIAKYTELQSPNLTFDFKRLDYLELLNNVINEFSSLAEEKNCIIETKFPKTTVFLVVDKTEIKLAISNIINNALRYSEENSTITVTVIERNNTIETIITDEGIGISEENLPNILNEFFVVNTYSEDKQKCIGLGLTIANKIIQHHKGEISITSSIGKGSDFKIILPKN